MESFAPKEIASNVKKKSFSQYDQVKIKVFLNEHHYIFCRFLLSRVLTLIRISERDAIKIALDLKKQLVNENRTEVTQEELEIALFQKMTSEPWNYQQSVVRRYQLVTKFYQLRKPFVILVCGTRCMGKSSLVTQLAERVNISNILQTSVVRQVIRNLMGSEIFAEPDTKNKNKQADSIENKSQGSPQTAKMSPQSLTQNQNQTETYEDVIRKYQDQCSQVKDGCNFDLSKCFKDGKQLLIDGSHIDPQKFLMLNQNDCQQTSKDSTPDYFLVTTTEQSPITAVNEMRKKMSNIDPDPATLIIPFFISISPEQHAKCVETRAIQVFQKTKKQLPETDSELEAYLDKKVRKYQAIQSYLSEKSRELGFTTLELDINNSQATIDKMHDIVLQRIEFKYKSLIDDVHKQ